MKDIKNSTARRVKHSSAAGASTGTKSVEQPRVAKIDVMRRTGNGLETIEEYSCEYYSKTELFRRIFDYFCDYPLQADDEIRITLANGLQFFWNFTLAHYCFAKGRMTEDEFILSTIESIKNHRRAAL
jgi:hypothetical protein